MDIVKIENNSLLRFAGKMIFQTDPYIYPALFLNEINTISVLMYLKGISGDLFSVDNIYLATEAGRNLGLICAYNKRFFSSYDNWCEAFSKAKISIPSTFTKAYYEYIDTLQKEKQRGLYISNVCVTPELRGQSVGYKMLLRFLENQNAEEVSLDVLKENQNAINLYKRLGFIVEDEFDGFSLDSVKPRCYHMTRMSRCR